MLNMGRWAIASMIGMLTRGPPRIETHSHNIFCGTNELVTHSWKLVSLPQTTKFEWVGDAFGHSPLLLTKHMKYHGVLVKGRRIINIGIPRFHAPDSNSGLKSIDWIVKNSN